MNNISKYQGLSQFGPAYRVMLENDTHASSSIDWILTKNMIQLCSETVNYLYSEYTPTKNFYKKESRPELEQYVKKAILDNSSEEEQIEAITRFTSRLQKKASSDLDLMQFGGIEEEIIARGSDWCTNVARVGCALCQVAGFPARIVHLFDTKKAYSGHVIIEVYRNKTWGAVDSLRNVIYHDLMGRPVSTWDLMNDHRLIEHHYLRDKSIVSRALGQFSGAAISNYFVWRWREYDYTVSKINDYYRSILEISNQGWPGGLRWIHGEDR